MNSKNLLLSYLRKLIPSPLRRITRRFYSLSSYDRYKRKLLNPFRNEQPEYFSPDSPYILGIVIEEMQYHKVYIAACREMGISYKLLNLSDHNWIDVFLHSGCDAFLIWPSAHLSISKEMYDDRLRILSKDLGQIIYPTWEEVWLYENKRRVSDWLRAKNLPKAETWIFYDQEKAIDFALTATYPLVYKTNIGASHSGVWILRSKQEALRLISRAFGRGVILENKDFRDRFWGSVYLQEYLPDVKEWRMIRIGDSYFGYRKEKVGDFHSGSGAWSWLDPPRELLNLLREICETNEFTSMDIDFFETPNGKFLVNELQTVFGASTPVEMLKVNGQNGRYIYNLMNQEWVFESGDFSRNMCANARVDYLVNVILPGSGRLDTRPTRVG